MSAHERSSLVSVVLSPRLSGRFRAALVTAFMLLAGLTRVHGSTEVDVTRTWEDLDPGAAIDYDKPSGTHFLEGAVVVESANVGACSGSRYLSKRGTGTGKGGAVVGDPGPLTLMFDSPRAFVGMCVGNPEGKLPRDITLLGYSAADATKPVVSARLVLPPGTPLSQNLSVCRLLDRDLVRVELHFGDEGLELLDDLRVVSVDGSTTRISFEEHAAGTLVESQYPGVTFLTRPEIVTSEAIGVGVHSHPQALRQRIAGEIDGGPMILTFNPSQGAVRIWTGYPPGEKLDGPLRVHLRAFAGGPKGYSVVASDGIELFASQALTRPLEVCSLGNDIVRVEIQFDSPLSGYEVIDDLEFGPRAVTVIPDTGAPAIWVDSPADLTVVEQPSSRPEHRTTTVTLRGRIEEDRALNSFRVQVLDASGNVRFDDGERLGIVRGEVPNFSFETPVLLDYGASVVRLTATDAAGHTSVLDHHLAYLGPPPVEVTRVSPGLGYPAIVFREASASGPAISNASPVVRLTGRHLNPETRFYLVPESRATLPPSAPDLIEVTPSQRSPEGDAVDLPIPDTIFRTPGRYEWLVWDLWNRPGMTAWTRGGAFEARAWPHAALWSIGFRNRDETNDIGDFEAVFGEEVLPGFLEPRTPIDGCSRGVNAINFFLGRYLPTLNAPGAGGSCFGFAAVSQFFLTGGWRTEGFDPAVRYPTGFRAPEPMRFTSTDCAPQSPANLWAFIQMMFGVHTSYEFLEVWADQTATASNGAMTGNPVATAEAVRAQPSNYVLAFTPFTSNVGHAVAPYRVEDRDADTIRIWVVDSNFPYDPTQPEDAAANRLAVNRFVDVNRRSNSFRFSIGATLDPALEYQTTNAMMGSALVAIPLSVFSNPRTIPMSDYLAEQYFGVTGDVEAELEVDDAGSWGWNELGEFHGTLAGLGLVPSFSGGDPASSNPLLLIPTNHSRVSLTLGGKDPAHRLITGNGGIVFGARRGDRVSSEKDSYVLASESGRPRSLRFLPGSPARPWQPELGMDLPGDGEVLYRFHSLQLESGQPVRLEALPDERGARFQNDSTKPIRFHLELSAGGVKSAQDRRWFGPFQLPAGAVLDLVPARWPAIDAIDARLDEDHDGKPDSIAVAPGLPIHPKQGDTGDCNGNGVLDAFDVAAGTSADVNDDGRPDECPPVDDGGNGGNEGGGGGEGGGSAGCPPKGDLEQVFAGLTDGPVPAEALGIARLISTASIRDGLLVATPPVELGSADPGTLSFRFDCPRGTVVLNAVNTSKSGSVRARAWAYSAADSTKPVAEATATLPAGVGQTMPLTLCRPLEEDIALVVLEFEGSTPEAVRSVAHSTRASHQVRRYDFEDRPMGTVVFGQYPGVVFPDRPLISLNDAPGGVTNPGTQMLRKAVSDQDSGPLILRFDPPQAEVRVRVGYPLSENDGRPLRITMNAFDGAKGSVGPIASVEAVIPSPRAFDRILRVVRCAADIREVRIQFVERPSGGIEAIDDLEFGPVPVPTTEPDTTAPVVRVVSPAPGAVIPQINPLNSTGGTNLVVEIDENRSIDGVVVVVRDAAGAEFRRLDDSQLRVTGTAPRFRLEATLPLAYGRNTVEIRVVDTSGNEGSNATEPLVLFYQGPAPVRVDSSAPEVGYPEDLIADAHPVRPTQFPEIRLPRTVFTLRGANLNRLVRVHAVRDDQAQVPPRTGTLIAAEIVSRNDEGTEMQVRLPAWVWQDLDVTTDLRLRWVIEDAWTRPDGVVWNLGGRFTVRQRPWPMTYGFAFVNEEGPNTLTDFDGVFGLNAYLSWTDHCWRDPIYLGFYEWGYSVTLNRSPGGSCFGMVAASQAIYLNDFDPAWLSQGFPDVARLPAGRFSHGITRDNIPDCGPRSPGSLWSWIQVYHGIQQSEEHLYQQLNQIVQRGGMWRGNIAARLAQLGTRPYAYLLCIKPSSGTTGHCVLPYRVEPLDSRITRIWVYDPNYPYNHLLPETHPVNVRSIHSYVDVDPAANNYVFDVDANFDTNNVAVVRNHFHAGRQWSGEGLTVTLLPTGNRTMPGLGYGLDYLFSAVSGDGRPEYANEAGQRWGWNAQGARVEEMDGVHPFTPFTLAGDETDQVSLLTRGSNAWSRVAIHAHGTNYQFVTGGGGVVFGIRNPGATPGAVDNAEQRVTGGIPRAVRFESEQPNTVLEPFVVLSESQGNRTNHVAWHWRDLRLPASAPVVFEADAVTGAIGTRNEGEVPIVVRLVRERAGEGGNDSLDYGTVVVPAGGSVRLTPSGPPDAPHLREEVDMNGDGVIERTVDHLPNAGPDAPRLVPVRADLAKKRLRLRIHGAARDDVAVERSEDLNRWEAYDAEPAVDDPAEVEGVMETGPTFFRLRRLR